MHATIGDLRHRLTVEVPVDVADSGGGATRTWQEHGVVWGRILPMAGRESTVRDKISGHVSHEIIIRYRSDVTPNMRLRYATRTFEIHAVLSECEVGRWLICHCEEVDL